MIRAFEIENGKLKGPGGTTAEGAVWLDLIEPTREDEQLVERITGLDVPTREDMHEIEASSRLYIENGAAFMTAMIPAQTEYAPLIAPVSFVLTPTHLVTIRYHSPKAFETFPMWAQRTGADTHDAESLLLALLEAIVDRLADLLEGIVHDIDGISRGIFDPENARFRDSRKVLEAIGRAGDLTSNMRDSLLTLDRAMGFLAQIALHRKSRKEVRERIKTLARDVRSLLDHAGFMAQKITFLLDASLGMINIEQNAIIKIFSVAAVIFLPPTLIASIYGMNFSHMPELGWPFGYALALALMVVSAILPYMFFKRRGWL